MGINRHGAERVYHIIRRCLARECELHSPLGGEVECDERYFGGRRKGPRGRGAAGKVPGFGLLKRVLMYPPACRLDPCAGGDARAQEV